MSGGAPAARRERYLGALLGLACGDAVGTTLEFRAPGSFAPIADMVGGGPFRLRPGEWTDDTSMALCLADSLVECGRFDPVDQLRRFVRWRREGYLSSNGVSFDIGSTVAAALGRFLETGDPHSGSTDPWSAGNGSLMRLAPVPLAFAGDAATAVRLSGESSRTTHGAVSAVDACRYLGALIVGALAGADKETLLSPLFSPVPGLWDAEPLCEEIREVAEGSYRRRSPPEIRGTGHVVRSLEAALWAFDQGATFEQGCLLAVNLGDDADTTGAVYGQLAGAHHGLGEAAGVPRRWRERLAGRETIERLATGLDTLSVSLSR